MDAEYRLIWREGPRITKARLAAALLPPHRIRLEVLDPLGGSRAVLTATEEGALLLDPAERVFRRFSSGSEAFEALSGMRIPKDFLEALLLGDPGASAGWSCSAVDDEDPRDRLCTGPGETGSVSLRHGGEEWEVRIPGSPLLRVNLKLFSGPPPGPADRLRIREESRDLTAELILRQLHFGAPAEDLFALQPPPSFHDASQQPTPSWILGGKP